MVMDNIGSVDITAIEVKQYVTNLSSTTYNGTAFVMVNANAGLVDNQQSYGKLYSTVMTTQPAEITTTNATYISDRYGVLTMVYSTTSVDGTAIERAVQFGWTYNDTSDVLCIDTDADGDLSEEEWRADGSLSIALTEHRYDSTGADTTPAVATIDIVSASLTEVIFKQSTGSYTDAGALAVDGQKLMDYVIYIPNNVEAKTYTGTIEFVAS